MQKIGMDVKYLIPIEKAVVKDFGILPKCLYCESGAFFRAGNKVLEVLLSIDSNGNNVIKLYEVFFKEVIVE
jgi:hypothetical protein